MVYTMTMPEALSHPWGSVAIVVRGQGGRDNIRRMHRTFGLAHLLVASVKCRYRTGPHSVDG